MKGLEKVPTKLVTLALSESPPDSELLGLRNPLLPSAAYDELQSLLVAIRHNIKTGGIVIKARARPGKPTHCGAPLTAVPRRQDFFLDFDHNNDGCITKHEFLRNIYRIAPKLSDAQAELFVKAYDAGHGVNFRTLQTDVEGLSDDVRTRRAAPPAGVLGP